MVKRVVLIGLVLSAGFLWSQKYGKEQYVMSTKITAVPAEFGRGQMVAIHASFQQQNYLCRTTKDSAIGYSIRIYDGKVIPPEPIWEKDSSNPSQDNSTPYLASLDATAAPNLQDDGKRVERDFGQFTVPSNAPGRLYVVLWRHCFWKDQEEIGQPSILSEHFKATAYGGKRWFRYSCRARGKTPSKECKYRPE